MNIDNGKNEKGIGEARLPSFIEPHAVAKLEKRRIARFARNKLGRRFIDN